jgi:protein-S-isoprenylcysteine O-methyltransferase Ste14
MWRPLAKVVLLVVASAGYLGLAMLGLGGRAAFFSHPALVALAIVFGRRFSGLVAIQPGHTLVSSGVYRYIRHPSYLGLLVNALGWGLAFRSGLGVLFAALLVPPLLARIHAGERLLQAQFGDECAAYCARTSRLIPGVS